MSRDRETTLDQFLGDAGDDGNDGTGNPASEAEAGAEPRRESETESESDAPEPAAPTYRWAPGGEPCAACDERVERLWRAAGERGGAFVCGSCKDWERGE